MTTTTNAPGVRIEFLDGTDSDTVQAALGKLFASGWIVTLTMADGTTVDGSIDGSFVDDHGLLNLNFHPWDEENDCEGEGLTVIPFDDIVSIGIL